MRQQGRLADWNDKRGFGFITPITGGARVFVHISAFPTGQRPAANDVVTYLEGRDERNRRRASDVLQVHPTRSNRKRPRGLFAALGTATLFFVALAGLVVLDHAHPLLLVPYAAFSGVAFALYGADKSAAQRGEWRIPETTLHAVALLGGWPGALVAQRTFRHKTTKQPFRTMFWSTVVANSAFLAWLVLGTSSRLG